MIVPNYEYTCMPCDTSEVVHQTYDSTVLPACSTCGECMVKVFTPPAVHFKGQGWGGK